MKRLSLYPGFDNSGCICKSSKRKEATIPAPAVGGMQSIIIAERKQHLAK